MDIYYNKKSSKVYVLTCKEYSLKIYDYKANKIYNIIYSIDASNISIMSIFNFIYFFLFLMS